MSLERLGVGTYKTASAADTEHFGELVAPCLEDGDVLILTGGLGVGKTHFTKGVFRCSILICTAWSMPTSLRIRAFLTCWAMRELACWSGASSSRMS